MKKWVLVIAVVLSCSAVHANDVEKIETLSSKVILQNTDGYFVFSDGSCWKVIGFSARWRSLSEWWNNIQLVPANYGCVPNDWFLGTHIEVYPKRHALQVDEADASNHAALKQCTHLLVNTRTEQVLFAIALTPAECIVQLSKEMHKDGYDQGFHKGRLDTYTNAMNIYNDGYAAGCKIGYTEGYQAALRGR
jgi:hypothetical protein